MHWLCRMSRWSESICGSSNSIVIPQIQPSKMIKKQETLGRTLD